MIKDEILRYITLCVIYKHTNDISPQITKSATEKENLLFKWAIEYLKKLDKEIAELKSVADFQTSSNMDRYFQLKRSKEKLTEAKKQIRNLLYVYQLGKNELATARIRAEAEQFLKEVEK